MKNSCIWFVFACPDTRLCSYLLVVSSFWALSVVSICISWFSSLIAASAPGAAGPCFTSVAKALGFLNIDGLLTVCWEAGALLSASLTLDDGSAVKSICIVAVLSVVFSGAACVVSPKLRSGLVFEPKEGCPILSSSFFAVSMLLRLRSKH